jgi:hypothetical protein
LRGRRCVTIRMTLAWELNWKTGRLYKGASLSSFPSSEAICTGKSRVGEFERNPSWIDSCEVLRSRVKWFRVELRV